MQTGRKFRPPSDQFCGCDVSGDLALLPAAQRQWTHAGRTRASERASQRCAHTLAHGCTRARLRVIARWILLPAVPACASIARVVFFSSFYFRVCSLLSLFALGPFSLLFSCSLSPSRFLSLFFIFFNWEWWRTSVAGRVGSGSERGGKRFAFDVFGQPIEFRRGTTSLKSRSE